MLTRRDFLATSATTAAGFAAAPALFAQPTDAKPANAPTSQPPKRTLRKAFYGHIDAPTVHDKLAMLRDAGFEGAELDSPTKIPMDEILDAMEKTGMKVHGLVDSVHWRLPLNSPNPGVRDDAIKAIETCLRDAKTLGATTILLVPAIVNKDLAYDHAYGLTQSALMQRAIPIARETGVQIGIENVWNNFLLSPLEAARYIDEINGVQWDAIRDRAALPPKFLPAAFHFDIGNIINFGWPDQWIRILGNRICKLHIKDFSRAKRDKEGLWKGFDVELGEGDAGWPAVMNALDTTGYSTAPKGNWATAEVRGGDLKRLTEVSKQMDRLFAL